MTVDQQPLPPRRGGSRGRVPRWLRWVVLGLSLTVLLVAGLGWYFYQRLDGNLRIDSATARELLRYEKARPRPAATGARNILLIGSDDRSRGGNREYGRTTSGQRSDTVILLHIAGDRKSAVAMSLPRDLMVPIPSCRRADGEHSGKQFNQFNFAYSYGGAACTIRVVETMTGIRVDHHMIVDFSGFKDMVDAVGGVEVCVRRPMNDKPAKLRLKAGRQVLDGEQALGYVRARKTVGDGSDTERMERQQEFLASLVKKVKSDGVLLNPLRLAPLLDAATKSLTTDPGLSDLTELYELVRGMRDIPMDKVHFLTVPRRPYELNTNRDELVQPDAEKLFRALREDRGVPFRSEEQDRAGGASAGGAAGKKLFKDGVEIRDRGPLRSGDPTDDPTYNGTTPTDDICR
ncbi:Transcriptional regulator LytR [Streptomyces sp. RB5]|uniref:Transcriptional regulator LytR n=1 Tax=Streptomyces smaragdinus TaxID=2585196 RepID=A0A7K0CRF6_9ACTN|nr:LCP family protein [Streptomyces smaragdinus]MQY16078.1 Transcriptional regulator LytR [Streptomyces smaragdinus]